MQRFAVTLRLKQLLLKAISVKKALNKGSDFNSDIAYLYNELGVTYYSADEIEKGMTCVRK